jgi:hypothetical protein
MKSLTIVIDLMVYINNKVSKMQFMNRKYFFLPHIIHNYIIIFEALALKWKLLYILKIIGFIHDINEILLSFVPYVLLTALAFIKNTK